MDAHPSEPGDNSLSSPIVFRSRDTLSSHPTSSATFVDRFRRPGIDSSLPPFHRDRPVSEQYR